MAIADAPLPLAALNGLPFFGFAAALLPVYPAAPWVPVLAYAQRPFLGLDHLHRTLAAIVGSSDPGTKEQIVRQEPDPFSPSSASPAAERAAASALPEEDRRALKKAQADYEKKFGFPLVLSLAGTVREDLLPAAEARVANVRDQEIVNAADEICRIARLRLEERVRE